MRRTLAVLWFLAATVPGLRAEGELLTLGCAQTNLEDAERLRDQGCLDEAALAYRDLAGLTGPDTAYFRGRAALGLGRIELARAADVETVRGPLMTALAIALEAKDRDLGRNLGATLLALARVEIELGGEAAVEPLRSTVDEIARKGGRTALGSGFFVRLCPLFRAPADQARLRRVLEAATAALAEEPDAPLTDRVEARGELARVLLELGETAAARAELETVFPHFADGSYFEARLKDLSFFEHPLKRFAGLALRIMPGIAKIGERKMLEKIAGIYARAGLEARAAELRTRAEPEPNPGAGPVAPAPEGGKEREGAKRPSTPPAGEPEAGAWERPLGMVTRIQAHAPGIAKAALDRIARSLDEAPADAPGRAVALARVAALHDELARVAPRRCDPAKAAPAPARRPPAPPPEPPEASWLY